MPVAVEISVPNIEMVTAALSRAPKKAFPAITRAVNRAGETARTRVLDSLSGILTLKRGDIAGNKHTFGGVKLQKSSNTGDLATIAARVTVTGKRIPVYRFGAKTIGVSARETAGGLTTRYKATSAKFATAWAQRNQGLGVQWQIRRQGGKKYDRHAFVAEMNSGHVGVFKRLGTKRLPIDEKFGPSIPRVAEADAALRNSLKVDVSEVLLKRLGHELGRAMKEAV